IAKTGTIVFDKTGTVTVQQAAKIHFEGEQLNQREWSMVKSLTAQSIHPLSKKIAEHLSQYPLMKVENFSETAGAGIAGEIDGNMIRAGSANFVSALLRPLNVLLSNDTRVYISINNKFAGNFNISSTLREGLKEQVQSLQKDFELYLLSGDQEGDRELMENIFPQKDHLFFQQSPAGKLHFIDQLQLKKNSVMMIGDGLNDAGALQQSNVGIAVSDDLVQFSPACDVILKGSEFKKLHSFIRFCKSGVNIIWFTFGISLLYNIAGVSYAVRGELSPLVAAVLMPLSSISVIIITTLATKWKAKRLGL
ncbi:MAG TPA: HAD-IC family P-type ATPase, partial [Chitinophagales bacterium]|nr:HAD-IC family P-type ATPase [Chitinophagales bacterium]